MNLADNQAFPSDTNYGMTLRDYFAAKAMQSLLIDRQYPWDSAMPDIAYKIADAMLKSREGGE